MPHLVVCPLSRLEQITDTHGAREMVTLLSSDNEVQRPSGIRPERHLFLDMNDISVAVEGLHRPEEHHVQRLLDFANEWDRAAPLLVHCWMGISRSTAAAYIIALSLDPQRDEMQLALDLRRLSPSATPNARMIALADNVLERDGRMVNAVKRIGRGANAYEGTPFILPLVE